MKTATLIAIISMALQTLASLIYVLQTLNVIEYSRSLGEIMPPLYFISNVGLLVFFIQLFQKQSKN